MSTLVYKDHNYGGTTTITDASRVNVDVGETSITAQQLSNNILGDFASIEPTTTASKAYAVGDYLVYNSKFYKVTSAIAQGGTITVGTNVTRTTVGDEIDALEDEKYEKPSGGIPASDLASAVQASLAKINIQTLDSGQDLNNYYDNGFYYIKTNVAHSPQDWAWLLVIGGVGTAQICFTVSKIFVRAYTGSPITWTDWRYVGLQQV